ncbi:MAG: transglutaminase domain-containing protein, partial [Planctomycetota bacterium JB042]
RPVVHPDLRERVRRSIEKAGRTEREQWDRELFGKGMFENRVHGSCTSSAIYLQTGLRAAGIPTRTVVCVPVIDASDPREVAMLDRLEHHGMRRLLKRAAAERGRSWASHTFNEVHVGGRWRRLNYAHLGQSSLFGGMMGLMTHVHTFRDHAEAGLVTWGLRDAGPRDDALFGGSNPYSCVEIDDRFGEHANAANPKVEEGFDTLTVRRLDWFDDPDLHPTIEMRLDDPETAGHLVFHVDEAILGEGPSQYADFYRRVDKEFVLRARDRSRDALRAHAARGYWVDTIEGVHAFYLRIEPDEFRRMHEGIEYALEAVDRESEVRWIVPAGISIVRR